MVEQEALMKDKSIHRLQLLCQEEEALFRAGRATDGEACYELFHRAIVNKEQKAWDAINTTYEQHIKQWIWSNSSRFDELELESLANEAWLRFWKAMTHEKFEQLDSLGKLLQYLKMCAVSCVLDYIRSQQARPQIDPITNAQIDNIIGQIITFEGNPETQVEEAQFRQCLWAWVRSQLKSEKEEIVAKESFLYEKNSAQIAREYPEQFSNVKRVYRIRENILKRLHRKCEDLLEVIR